MGGELVSAEHGGMEKRVMVAGACHHSSLMKLAGFNTAFSSTGNGQFMW